MKTAHRVGLRAQVGRLLMAAAVRLLGEKHSAWARAMQAEALAVEGEREALAFAWGCFVAALGQALQLDPKDAAQAQRLGVVAVSVTVLLGGLVMHRAGAPAHHLPMNLLSLAFAIASFHLLPRQRLQVDALLRARLACAMAAVLLLGSLGTVPPTAAGWFQIGPVAFHLGWLLLPVVLTASAGPSQTAAGRRAQGSLALAIAALAVQGDPALAAATAAVVGLRAWHARSAVLTLLALGAAAVAGHAARGWTAPEPMPFVDQVVSLGFAQGPATGLVLLLLQLLPLVPALRHRPARELGLVWGLLVVLSVPGWMPSPLLGFGGSFIGAYLLGLALLGDAAADRPRQGPGWAMVPRGADPPTVPRSRLT